MHNFGGDGLGVHGNGMYLCSDGSLFFCLDPSPPVGLLHRLDSSSLRGEGVDVGIGEERVEWRWCATTDGSGEDERASAACLRECKHNLNLGWKRVTTDNKIDIDQFVSPCGVVDFVHATQTNAGERNVSARWSCPKSGNPYFVHRLLVTR